jgi:HK97 family phage major capsid protein/HK97 family phage prohead protease
MDTIIKAGAQSGSAPFTFVLTTGDVDRMGDVVVPNGVSLTNFKRNPVALFAHNQRQPIGTWENIRREGDALIADLKLARAGTSRMIDEIRALIEQKIIRACSIGFGVVKSEPIDPERPYAGVRYTKSELLEASLVAVPANANALALKGLSPETRALVIAEGEQGNESTAANAHADTATQPRAVTRKGTPMKLAERIKAAQARLKEIDTQLTTLQAVAESVDELSDEQVKSLDALTDERATVEKNLTNLEKLEKAIGAGAEAQGGNALTVYNPTRRSVVAAEEPKGTLITRMGLAHAYAHIHRRPIADVVREHFAHDQRIEAVLKSSVPVADTTTGGWAKELVMQDVQGFIEGLAPISAYAALATRGFIVNFGTAGSVSVPYRGGSNTDLAGAFVGENGVIPVKRTTIGANVLNRYKMAVITTLTKELTRASTPQAEALLRRFMADDTAVALDHAFLDASPAVAGTRPAGILNGVAAIAASAAPLAIDKAIADLKALISALITSGNGVRPVFLMNPAQRLTLSMIYSAGVFVFRDELAQNKLMGADLVTSTNVPAGDVILIDAANFATGLGSPEFDASDTATLVMANSDAVAPTHATDPVDSTIVGTAEQVPPDGGISVYKPSQRAAGKVGENAQAISMFQQWATALRTVLPVSWGLTRSGSVAWVDNVGW